MSGLLAGATEGSTMSHVVYLVVVGVFEVRVKPEAICVVFASVCVCWL